MSKIKNSILPLVLFLLFTSNVFSQRAENPWAVSVGVDLIYFNSDENIEDVFTFGAPSLSLSTYLGGGFSVSTQFMTNKLGKKESDIQITSFDNVLKYNFTEKDIVPFLFAGYGFTQFTEKVEGNTDLDQTSGAPLFGAGVSLFVNDNISLNTSLSYRKTEGRSSYTHLQHIIGLSYNFGAGDSDKDGVSDKRDVCPNIPGLKEFSGCPDSDGDGIPDNKDACPQEAGSESNGGCPDTDGDGIIDKDDSCPSVAGSTEMNGCPDTDGDTVADNLDKCPNIAGDPANNGCPWADRDNDGIADKDDACPDEAGIAANNGCPAEPTGLIEFINSSKSTITFSLESVKINEDGTASLEELVALMNKYPKANLVLEGHASSDGPSNYNQKLSEKRAESVKTFLTDAGVDASRLEAVGYGEDQPAEDNATQKGRKANRRAKINRKL